MEGTSVLSQLSLNPGKNKFLALHLLRRSVTHPHQPEMADGLQMQNLFLAVFGSATGKMTVHCLCKEEEQGDD